MCTFSILNVFFIFCFYLPGLPPSIANFLSLEILNLFNNALEVRYFQVWYMVVVHELLYYIIYYNYDDNNTIITIEKICIVLSVTQSALLQLNYTKVWNT